ncbi:MAG: hypothetical protein IE923_03175 [Micrococcales bacterium]|nr:hypothetical protein [Micrococcales bacterium]
MLEGLDKTGKSTQATALRAALDPERTLHVHMPSGLSMFTRQTYAMLEVESQAPRSALGTQLAHLACHAESVPLILEALKSTAVVLDRWWWSTFAYGWYNGKLPDEGITELALTNLVGSIWGRVSADVVFLFDRPYVLDANNSDPIYDGYQELAGQHAAITSRVPNGDPNHVTAHLIAELKRRGLLVD